jgi:hypothetical protein
VIQQMGYSSGFGDIHDFQFDRIGIEMVKKSRPFAEQEGNKIKIRMAQMF